MIDRKERVRRERERLEARMSALYNEELYLRGKLADVERKVNALAALIALADAKLNG